MKLKQLFKDIPDIKVHGPKDPVLTGVCANSKVLVPGNLFVAKRGKTFDGSAFIPEAIDCGAVAVLTDIFDPSLSHITQVVHPDVNAIEALVGARFYEHPSRKLFTVGITGTNGKTSTSFMIRHLLEEQDTRTGLIGSIQYIIGQQKYDATHTTPDVLTCHKLLREMTRKDCQAAVMEVTSHALTQGRVAEIEFDTAVFTNLSQDHLDYHGDMQSYAAAKRKLFQDLGEDKIVICNADDPWTDTVVRPTQAKEITYGITNAADVRASNIRFTAEGSSCTITAGEEECDFSWSLLGRFNIYNLLATVALGISRKITLQAICEAMSGFPGVAGRLERVADSGQRQIFVDFSHTPDALDKALETLREASSAKLTVVFGCGGDRDRDKRPRMAEAAEKWADRIIVTSDNPRSEDPLSICNEIMRGFSSLEKVFVQVDRREAIRGAIQGSPPDGIVLIAGKGHETYQIFARQTVEFDDRAVAKEMLQEMVEAAPCAG